MSALKLGLFGAAPDTGNLGVSALCHATLLSLSKLASDAQFVVFDYGRGLRYLSIRPDITDRCFQRCGAYVTRRYYRRESLWNIRWSAKLGGLDNAGAKAMLCADAVLDISGGDSFTDLYGTRRFESVVYPKRLAIELGKPLILLPQTYGPFRDAQKRRIASQIVGRAAQAWARDPQSYDALKDLAGSYFDPLRHRFGVDVAFGLEAVQPSRPLPSTVEKWLRERSREVIGMNVSGLIYNDAANAAKQYGLKADYRKVVFNFLRHILRETDCNVLLVPHVVTPRGHYESDCSACEDVLRILGDSAAARIAMLPPLHHPSEVKWVISQLDWFCGTRMHATIAALSSGIPTASLSYSSKAAGVFEGCGLGDHVHDLRKLCTDEIVHQLVWSHCDRQAAIISLHANLPNVIQLARVQMDAILAACFKFNRDSVLSPSIP